MNKLTFKTIAGEQMLFLNLVLKDQYYAFVPLVRGAQDFAWWIH